MENRRLGRSGRICEVYGCYNSYRKKSIWCLSECEIHSGTLHRDCACLEPFSLHVFPKDETLRREWIGAINRKDFNPGKFSRVCSIHFLDGFPTSQNPVPQLQLGYDKKLIKGRRPLQRSTAENIPKRAKFQPLQTDECSIVSNSLEANQAEFDVSVMTQGEDVIIESSITNSIEGGEYFELHTTLPSTRPEGIGHVENSRSLAQVPPPCFKLTKCVETSSQACQTSVSTCTIGTQWEDLSVSDHNYCTSNLRRPTTCNKGVQANLKDLPLKSLSLKDCVFYTGLQHNIFVCLLNLMTPCVQHLQFLMPVSDQLLLVLMRLRLGLLFYDLGRRFDCSTSLASKIFNSWVPLLAKKLQNLVCWLPRETIRATIPKKVKGKYPNTTCIIDCSEVFIQRPTYLQTRAKTYSNYKHHNTMKFLVAVSPCGYVMFVSKCYGGRASDQHIVTHCGILDYLLPGDEVLADRGFTIEECLWLKQAQLNIPCFTRGRTQLTESEVTKTRRIASARIHVERAIARLKQYRILKSVLPLDNLRNTADHIITICAGLTNLQPLLIKDSD